MRTGRRDGDRPGGEKTGAGTTGAPRRQAEHCAAASGTVKEVAVSARRMIRFGQLFDPLRLYPTAGSATVRGGACSAGNGARPSAPKHQKLTAVKPLRPQGGYQRRRRGPAGRAGDTSGVALATTKALKRPSRSDRFDPSGHGRGRLFDAEPFPTGRVASRFRERLKKLPSNHEVKA